MLKNSYMILVAFACLQASSCKKYLDKPSSQSVTTISTLEDLQALLDISYVINKQGSDLNESSADNYFVTATDWQSLLSDGSSPVYLHQEALSYIWNKEAINSDFSWSPYQAPILYANIVLDALPGIAVNEKNKDLWNGIKGTAFFFRSFNFLGLAQLYCRPYSSSAATDLGIPLPLNSNINERSVRGTVLQTYDQILTDLKQAAELLPEITVYPTRPNKAAAYGALARTCLFMRDYANAGRYADSCLKRNSSLMDYNSLIPVGFPPIPAFNPEIIFWATSSGSSILDPSIAIIDTILYQSYDSNDLRKTVFFRTVGTDYKWQGSYAYNLNLRPEYTYITFDGIVTDEIYLTRAECYARVGNTSAAMANLNALMVKRWKNDGSWAPFTATDATDALNKILTERRKELCFRNLRWPDLRRFNLDDANITLKRIIGGTTYTLPPNDLRWVMLIPQDVINRSGMQQNPR